MTDAEKDMERPAMDVANYYANFRKLEDTITTLRAEVERLGGLVYAPGRWKCVKCDFTLLQSSLNAATGNVTARHEAGGVCPNCNSPLWRVSWKAEAQENQTISETQFDRAMAAEAERDAAIARAEKAEAAIRWALGEEGDFPPRGEGEPAYWWRKELRRLASLSHRGGVNEQEASLFS